MVCLTLSNKIVQTSWLRLFRDLCGFLFWKFKISTLFFWTLWEAASCLVDVSCHNLFVIQSRGKEGLYNFIFWNLLPLICNGWENGRDDFYAEDQETYATVLDKLLAWEKKLYDEVKVHSSVIFLIVIPTCMAIFFWRNCVIANSHGKLWFCSQLITFYCQWILFSFGFTVYDGSSSSFWC